MSTAPILVVEDDDDARFLFRQTLVAEGHAVVEAKNGRQALELLIAEQAHEPCLIVLDLFMPLMSGWEFLAIVKNYVRFVRIPVIVVSGIAPRPETLASGTVTAWVAKPIDAVKFVELVSKHALRHCDNGGTRRDPVEA